MICVYLFTRMQKPVKTLRDVFVSAYECFHVTNKLLFFGVFFPFMEVKWLFWSFQTLGLAKMCE